MKISRDASGIDRGCDAPQLAGGGLVDENHTAVHQRFVASSSNNSLNAI